MNMVVPYLVCQLVGGVFGAAMAKVNLPHFYATELCILDPVPHIWAELCLVPTGDNLRREVCQRSRGCVRRAAV